jgi:hypothetical protein
MGNASATVEELETAFRYMVDQHLADVRRTENRQKSPTKEF